MFERAMLRALMDPSPWGFFGAWLLAVGIAGMFFSPRRDLALITTLAGVSCLFLSRRLKKQS